IPVAFGSVLLIEATIDYQNQNRYYHMTGILGSLVFTVAFIFLLSYFFRTPFFYGTQIIPISATSAFVACLTGFCLITAAGPKTIPLNIVSGSSFRAILLRRFFPLTSLTIIILSVIMSRSADFFQSNGTVFISVFLIGSIFVTWWFVSRISAQIDHRIEQESAKRIQAEEDLRRRNMDLTHAYERIASSEEDLSESVEELMQKEEDLHQLVLTLKQSESRFHTLFETMKEGMVLHEIIYDSDHTPVDYRIIDANPALETLIGLSPEMAKGKLASDLYQISPAPYLDLYAKVADTGESYFFETYFEPMDKYFSISAFSPGKGLFATVFLNITDRKRSELALKVTNEALAQAQKIAHVGSWIYDLVRDQISWSDELYRIFGYEPGMIDLNLDLIRSIIHPDDRDAHDRILHNAIKTQIFEPFEYRLFHPDGSLHYVSTNGVVILDENGASIELIGVCQDITEQKQRDLHIQKINEELFRNNEELAASYEEIASSEEEIRSQMEQMVQSEALIHQSERRLAMAQQIGKTGSFEMILESEDIIGSDEFFRIYGMKKTKSGLVPYNLFKTYTPGYHDVLQGIVKLIQEGEPYTQEMVINPADGSDPRYISLLAQLITNDEEIPIRVIGVIQDITKEHEIEHNLQETKEFLENLISHTNCPIIVWNQLSKITEFNHAFEILTGMSRSEVLSQDLYLIFPEESKEKSEELVKTMMTYDRLEGVEIPIQHLNGSIRSLIWNSAHITGPDGDFRGVVAQGTDITEQKRLTRDKNAALEQIKRNIAELSVLNDTIRNPLMVILTLSELENPDFAGKILHEVERIDKMITQLDSRWMESDKILEFLRKHYQIEIS
ncbi:MAG: PAS domain S-box protein, partial [Methanobacteriota archaeon]